MAQPSAPLPLDNPYALMGLFLSPNKTGETLALLAEEVRRETIAWESLLYQANLHFCTPLWYVRMRQDALLCLLPSELREYLGQLHQANVERNAFFREALREQLLALQKFAIPAVLLKGAATFCDDLYGDPGARMLGDIDILVAPAHLEAAEEAFADLGYRKFLRPTPEGTGYMFGYRPHHLPRMHKPGTPVAVEIHYQVARGQGGRVLPVEQAWACREQTALDEFEAWVLDPTRRLLHNTIHALITQKLFIRSNVSLRDLAEFTALAHRYGTTLDWDEWLARGAANGLETDFRTYLALACRLASKPHPQQGPPTDRHLARILATAKHLTRQGCHSPTPGHRIVRGLTRLRQTIYYHRRLPGWLWNNPCLAQGLREVPRRLRCIAKIYLWMWRKKFREKEGGTGR